MEKLPEEKPPTFGEDRRQTRIVFPSGRQATVWKVLTAVLTGWATWLSSEIASKKPNNCTPIIIQSGESLERVLNNEIVHRSFKK